MGCTDRRLRLPRGHCRGFLDVLVSDCRTRENQLAALMFSIDLDSGFDPEPLNGAEIRSPLSWVTEN
jgi:hypothetical protein